MQDPLRQILPTAPQTLPRVGPAPGVSDFLPLQAAPIGTGGGISTGSLPLDPEAQDHWERAAGWARPDSAPAWVDLSMLGVLLRSSLSSACGFFGPEVSAMDLPHKTLAQWVQLTHLLKKRGVLAKVFSLYNRLWRYEKQWQERMPFTPYFKLVTALWPSSPTLCNFKGILVIPGDCFGWTQALIYCLWKPVFFQKEFSVTTSILHVATKIEEIPETFTKCILNLTTQFHVITF